MTSFGQWGSHSNLRTEVFFRKNFNQHLNITIYYDIGDTPLGHANEAHDNKDCYWFMEGQCGLW